MSISLLFGALVVAEAARKKQAPVEEEPEAPSIREYAFFRFSMWGGFEYAMELSLLGYTFLLATKLRAMEESRPRGFFWCESVARLLTLCYGGGTLVPIALGHRPFPLACDAGIPMALFAWWLTHNAPFDGPHRLYEASKLVRCAVAFLFEVLRCNVILKWVVAAHAVLPASKYYAVPVVGPLICGTLAGCFGGLIHSGYKSFETEVSWLVQSALYCSLAYQLAVYDPNTAPILRDAFQPAFDAGGDEESWKELAHCFSVYFVALIAVLQEGFLGKDFNPFAVVHGAAYKVTGVPDPKDKKD